MKRFQWILVAVVLGIGIGLLLSRCGRRRVIVPYELVMLPAFPGGHVTAVFDINDEGVVVGRAELPRDIGRGRAHAVLWRHRELVDLGVLPRGGSEADRITPHGTIVGWSTIDDQFIHAVAFSATGLTDFGSEGGFAARAVGADDSGDILISVDNMNGSSSAVLERGGRWTPLGRLPGRRDTLPSDIAPSGEVVGAARSPGREMAFVWRGRISPLPTPSGFTNTIAHRINAAGEIAGSASNGPSDFHAVLWKDDHPEVLTTNGSNDSDALALNDRGLVVGVSNGHAVAWKAGRIVDLNNVTGFHLHTTLQEAVAVNNHGEIVCNGVVDDIPHAFLLVPAR